MIHRYPRSRRPFRAPDDLWNRQRLIQGISPSTSKHVIQTHQPHCLTLWLSLVGLLLAVILIGHAPTLAQSSGSPFPEHPFSNPERVNRAPVLLDSRPVFSVSAAGDLTAKERASVIQNRLMKAVNWDMPPQVEVIEKNQSPTIQLDGEELLTVTQDDVEPNQSPSSQAKLWAKAIERSIEQAQLDRSDEFWWRALLKMLASTAIVLVLQFGFSRFWHILSDWIRSILLPDEDNQNPQRPPIAFIFLSRFTLVTVQIGLWVALVAYVANLFYYSRRWSYWLTTSLITSFTAPLITIGDSQYSILDTLFLLGLFLGVIILAGAITNTLRIRVLRLTGINRGAQEAIAGLTKYTLISLGGIILLQIWGLDLSSLALVASALGVGIGIGLQNIAKDFGSGIVLLFERTIQVGDFVNVGDYTGTVERIGARSTLIRTLDQISIIVPNSRFLDNEVINWNHNNPISRLHLPVGIAYGSNLDQVRDALLKAPKGCPGVLFSPEPAIFFQGFGDSCLNFELSVWIAEPSRQFDIKSDLYFRIEQHLRDSEIEIPFPQRDLHVRSGSLPLEFSPQLQQTLAQISANTSEYQPNNSSGQHKHTTRQNIQEPDQRATLNQED